MKLTLQDLAYLYPHQIWLDFPTNVEPMVHKTFSNETGCHYASMNSLCVQALINWIKQDWAIRDQPAPCPNWDQLPMIWDVVNGTALIMGQTRLILVPSDLIDTETFTVPQEWVDIPHWAGDYYLAAQVDFERKWIQIWGYTAWQTLKEKANYDPVFRTYELEREALIADVDLLDVACELNLEGHVQPQQSSGLAMKDVDALLKKLSQPSPYSPRLAVDFQQWSALIGDDQLRQRLYNLRLSQANLVKSPVAKPVLNLALWLENRLDGLAQELAWILLPPLGSALRGQRSPSQELETVRNQLRNKGIDIPEIARGAYHDLQLADNPFRLYAVTWPLEVSESASKWSLLLILMDSHLQGLPKGTRLLVQDQSTILIDEVVKDTVQNEYLYGGVIGRSDETFRVKIGQNDGSSLELPHFGFLM